MVITKKHLLRIVNEEVEHVLSESKSRKTYSQKMKTRRDQQRREKIKRRQKNIFPITEDDLEELNVHHDSDGRFSSKVQSTCDSSYFVDRNRTSKGGSLTDKADSGRGPTKKGQGRRRCKDDSLKWETKVQPYDGDDSEYIRVKKGALETLLSKKLGVMLDVFLKDDTGTEETLTDGVKSDDLQARCKRMGLYSLRDFLILQNNLEASSKGNLFKNKGKRN